MPDNEMTKFLEGVTGAIGATNFEQHALWEKYTQEYGVEWDSRNFGLLDRVGTIADMPVCVSLHVVRVGGNKTLFYHATSQVVDHRMIDKWLDENMPATARRDDGRVNKTDATNSHIVAPFVKRKPGRRITIVEQTPQMTERAEVDKLTDELFTKIQRAQGNAFCSDGETFPTKEQFFERIRGRLEWNKKASRIMSAFLRRHGQS